MRKLIIYVASFIIFFFGSMGVAATEFITGEIRRIYPASDGRVLFRLKDDACITGGRYYYFKMNEEDARGKYASKNWYSMLLASAVAGKEIRVAVDFCPTEGNVEIKYIFQEY